MYYVLEDGLVRVGISVPGHMNSAVYQMGAFKGREKQVEEFPKVARVFEFDEEACQKISNMSFEDLQEIDNISMYGGNIISIVGWFHRKFALQGQTSPAE